MPIKVQGGKEYKLVSERLVQFYEMFPDYRILPRAIHWDQNGVVMAVTIEDDSGNEIARGHAEGSYSGGDKVIEKTETTACGRALAFLHPDLMGSEIASADEIGQWMQGSNDNKLLEHVAAVREHWESIVFIKHELGIPDDEASRSQCLSAALEAWREVGEEAMRILWRAPSKGGIFTTLERKLLDEASTEDYKMRKDDEPAV